MKFISIAELGQITSGGTPKTSVSEYWNGEIPWLTPGDLSNFDGTYFTGASKRSITLAGVDNSAAKLLPKNTLLLTIRAPIGYSALTAFPLATNQDYKAIVLHESIDPFYALYALRFATPQLLELGRGATIEGINLDSFETVKIPLPSLDEQRRIARILDQADRLRRLRRHARQQTDTFLQSVFIEMFGDPFTNPMSWDWKALDDDLLLDAKNGYSLRRKISENIGTIVLRIRDVGAGYIDYSEPNRIPLSAKDEETYALKENDLLLIRVNGNPDLVGRAALFHQLNETIAFNDHIIRTRFDESQIEPVFLCHLLNSPYGRKKIRENVTTTAGQYTINRSGLSNIVIPLPDIDKQKIFVGIEKQFAHFLKQQLEAERQAELNFQALLHRAFTGQLIRETASV